MNATTPIIHLIPNQVSAHRYVEPMVQALAQAGFGVELWVEPDEQGDAFYQRMQVRKRLARFDLRLNPFALLARLVSLWREFARMRPAGVHAHQTKGGLLPLLAALLAGVPVRIYHNHGSAYWGTSGLLQRAVGLLERWNCALATHVLIVNPALREVFVRDGLVAASKVQVLGPGSACGLDLADYPPEPDDALARRRERAGLSLPDGAFVVLYVGRPHKRKGFDFLLKAWLASGYAAPDAVLLLAGCGAADVQRVIGEQRPGIYALGNRADMRSLYLASDVVVLPSEHEGMGYALLEGGACARPLLVSDIPGVRMLVRDGVEGLVHALDDQRAFLDCLNRLHDDPALRRRLGEQARLKAMQFEQGKVLAHLVDFYRRIFT
jgi:N,N'-diacetylbacillosaminyl-diphospho-undecaprenol alpha-1,3-N-acetylgalactosaminyltransferase